jgi:hypothetical protein
MEAAEAAIARGIIRCSVKKGKFTQDSEWYFVYSPKRMCMEADAARYIFCVVDGLWILSRMDETMGMGTESRYIASAGEA